MQVAITAGFCISYNKGSSALVLFNILIHFLIPHCKQRHPSWFWEMHWPLQPSDRQPEAQPALAALRQTRVRAVRMRVQMLCCGPSASSSRSRPSWSRLFLCAPSLSSLICQLPFLVFIHQLRYPRLRRHLWKL